MKLRLWRNVGISELTWAQDPEYAAPWLPGMLNRSVLSRLKLSGWSITCMASLKIKINTIINCFFFLCHNSAGEHNALTLSMSMTKQLKGFRALYDPARWGIFLMNFCFIFYDPQSGPGRLFTLNLGFRGTLSWASLRPGETRIFRLSADWSEREEMRWKFVGDRRFKVSCRLVPSLSWFILWKLQYFGARRRKLRVSKARVGWQMRYHHKLRFIRTKLSQHFYHPRRSISRIFSISLFEVEYSFESSKLKIQKFQLKVK